jgi:hypothetical protein
MRWKYSKVSCSFVAVVVGMLLSSCDVREILPNDLSDPAHARYVASGDKAKDRREWQAALWVCISVTEPIIDAIHEECLTLPGNTASSCTASERGGLSHMAAAMSCADGWVGSDEFSPSFESL